MDPLFWHDVYSGLPLLCSLPVACLLDLTCLMSYITAASSICLIIHIFRDPLSTVEFWETAIPSPLKCESPEVVGALIKQKSFKIGGLVIHKNKRIHGHNYLFTARNSKYSFIIFPLFWSYFCKRISTQDNSHHRAKEGVRHWFFGCFCTKTRRFRGKLIHVCQLCKTKIPDITIIPEWSHSTNIPDPH